MKNKKWLLGVAVFSLFFLAACQQEPEIAQQPILEGRIAEPYRRTLYPMDTVVTLQIFNEGKDAVLDKAVEHLLYLEEILNVNESSLTEASEVARINDNAGIQPVEVSEGTFFLIQTALDFSRQTAGVFNAAIGPLTSLWNIGFEDARRPEDWEIQSALTRLDYEAITLDENNLTVFLHEPGMRLDLGGIAKGYMADELTRIFIENDVDSGIINIGGDIFLLGTNARGNEWRVGISDPFDPRSAVPAISFLVENRSVVTSGVYERYFEYEGVKYHHILDSSTGFPFKNDVAGITIVAENAIAGEKYTTLAFGLGIEAGLEAIEEVDGVEAIFITFQREIYHTSGLQGQLRVEADDFTIID